MKRLIGIINFKPSHRVNFVVPVPFFVSV